VEKEKEARINHEITDPECRVVSDDGTQLGILKTAEAIALAEEKGLDLGEVGGGAKPPVCKIMDYGKYKYVKKKRQQEARKKQVVIQVKEVKLRPKTDDHDRDTKVAHIRKFLDEHDKVKVTMMFRGREVVYANAAMEQLLSISKELEDIGTVEASPKMEGRNMFLVMAPKKKPGSK